MQTGQTGGYLPAWQAWVGFVPVGIQKMPIRGSKFQPNEFKGNCVQKIDMECFGALGLSQKNNNIDALAFFVLWPAVPKDYPMSVHIAFTLAVYATTSGAMTT